MTNFKFGNAPCSWGTQEFDGDKAKQVAFDQMLDELVETGYTGTELGELGYMPTDPAALRSELTKRKLTMLGAYVPVALKDEAAHADGVTAAVQTARLLASVATSPAPFLVLADNNGSVPLRTRNAGRIQPDMGLSASEWRIFAAGAERVASAVRDQSGLRTVFHHHCGGYIETPEEISRLLDLTSPELLGLVFDTGHYCFGSGERDAVVGLKRFGERVWYIHCKDCDPAVAEQTRINSWGFFQAVGAGVFCELGKGCVDFSNVLRWARRRRYDHFLLVEQDVLMGMGAPKESARRNREYLRSIEKQLVEPDLNSLEERG